MGLLVVGLPPGLQQLHPVVAVEHAFVEERQVALDREARVLAGIARGGTCHEARLAAPGARRQGASYALGRNIPRPRARSSAATPTAIQPATPPTSGGHPVPTSHPGVGRISKKSRPTRKAATNAA